MRHDSEEIEGALRIAAGAIGAEPVNGDPQTFWPRIAGRVICTPDMPAGGYANAEMARRAGAAHQRQAQLYLESAGAA